MPEDSSSFLFQFTFRGAPRNDSTTLLTLSSLLYDINLAYELVRLATDPAYSSYLFRHQSIFRNSRPLVADDRLLVERMSQNSPLELTATIVAVSAALGGVWYLTQIVEKFANWQLTRRKLLAEVELAEGEANNLRTRAELTRIRIDLAEDRRDFPSMIETSGAKELVDRATVRIERSDTDLEEAAVLLVRKPPMKPK